MGRKETINSKYVSQKTEKCLCSLTFFIVQTSDMDLINIRFGLQFNPLS